MIRVERIFGVLPGRVDMRVRCKVVYLIGLDLDENLLKAGSIAHIALVKDSVLRKTTLLHLPL
jgi:hypothetical protein